ncbi:MAG: glycoside hydrolase family 95 protein [Candidatus Hinthialibacter antarcticus]|nr:glycoside hydrolase family 95 protein [Candidatus Hinthialibacter antarcticus]
MKNTGQKFYALTRALLVISAIACTMNIVTAGQSNMRLWYEQPAKEWVEALPVGNGRLGAMVFGGVEQERIQFNEDTLWKGVPRDYINPKALETLPKVRQLLFEGKQREAQEVANDMMSLPLNQEAYQPFGDVNLTFPKHQSVENYERELDLNTAVATTTYKVGDVTYKREVFSSFPDQAIVIRLSADQPNAIDCSMAQSTPHPYVDVLNTIQDGAGLVVLTGRLDGYDHPPTKSYKPSCLRFESQLRIEVKDGNLAITDEGIDVVGASEVILKLCAATSYKNYRDIGANPSRLCDEYMRPVAEKSFDDLKQAHVADYQNLFNRLSIDLGETDAAKQPTNERIKQFSEQADPQLVSLYYQYGRYLLISCSRPGSQPATLQGIWNQELNPPWDSKWTVNINTEMNYWPAEMCNLSECHEPLFSMLEDLVYTGGAVAREHYGARGWVLHHNSDVWRGAAPINASNHGIWMTGGAWLSQHLWWRYEFTRDAEFLRNRAYPIMRGAALFFVDFLIEDPKTGWLISTPSNSPENGGLVAGPSMDHQIIRNLLGNCIRASEILGTDEYLRNTWKSIKEKIAPNQIGQYGQLQEWLEDKDNPKDEHRHVSHLWALHPGNEITPLQTPKFAEACKVTLSHRGDGGTGWSKAWKVNFWARLHDGDHSFKMLSELFTKSTLPNMFDTHPPFQIDGNFGGISGITEMLLQSHTGEIHLLPALPGALASGSIKGLCARGGFYVDLDWSDGVLKSAKLTARVNASGKVRYQDKVVPVELKKGESVTFGNDLSQG